MVYTVKLVNFHTETYEGASLQAAKETALRHGFEAVILQDDAPLLTWSPISGWRDMCG